MTSGMFDFDSRASTQLRVPRFLWLLVFLLNFNCSITRTVSKASPDASTKPHSDDANSLSESNRTNENDADDSDRADVSNDATTSDDSGSVDAQPREEAQLESAPLIFATTDTEFGLNVVLSQGERDRLDLQIHEPTQTLWSEVSDRTIKGDDVVQWRVRALTPSTEYEYRLLYRAANGEEEVLYDGRIQTRREQGESFSFCLLADSHIFVDTPDLTGPDLALVAQSVEAEKPDFVVHLGDILDFHYFGFNAPPPESLWTKIGYLSYRDFMGNLLGRTTHFSVIGNWDGENGDFTDEEIDRSRSQRLLYLPGPDPSTYPQGGSEYQDYYAFTWGDALFIVLNVMSYTLTAHSLSGDIGLPDDWTLGESQLLWLENTLEDSESKWKMIFIHHAVGGNAGDEANSAYGRGGGRAALVGEQETIHDLMQDYGVDVFFYGHDHVFFDMVVDGIHYTIPGSTGALWKFPTSDTGYPEDAYWPDSGYARVDVTPNRIDVVFISINGDVLYEYDIE